ncbi:MAG: DUF1569 domain-containing protein [Ginsengibacter sp.]
MKNLFTSKEAHEVIDRINQLDPDKVPQWGKMNADQMLAHCNVAYSFVFEPEKYKRPGPVKKFLLKTFVKKFVVGEQPYKRNSRTSPDFLIINKRNFEEEKHKLVSNIKKVQLLGENHFEGKDNMSFGSMTSKEWNILFYKHLDHHLQQFGV